MSETSVGEHWPAVQMLLAAGIKKYRRQRNLINTWLKRQKKNKAQETKRNKQKKADQQFSVKDEKGEPFLGFQTLCF